MTPRAPALDTLRALAITLVFAYHYRIFVSGEPSLGWTSVVGWVGVDLFFVLSGYLIGNQLFAALRRGEPLSLKTFYARRALRTWPAFWVVLAAYFLFPSVMGGRPPPPLWSFLTFTQNFGLQPGTAFSHAWSLCIEEQFYLVLPLVVLAARRFGTHRSQAWLLLAGLMMIGITARALLWARHGLEATGQMDGYYPHIYYATLCRFDEFLPGVAVALLKNFHPTVWRRVQARGQTLLAVALVATAGMLYGVHSHYFVEGVGYGFFMTVFGYSLMAMAFALLLMAALSPSSWLHRAHIPGAATLALWSYSIYLTHKAVGFIVKGQAASFELSPTSMLLVTVVLSVAMGGVLYLLVERPFMALRQRHFPVR